MIAPKAYAKFTPFVSLTAVCLVGAVLSGCGPSGENGENLGEVRLRLVTPVFINELHYDNTGTDAGEAIEIAGPAGTDLTGYSIVLYNGNGNAVYDTDALSGVIPDQDNGFGTIALTYPSNGIQNGPPDAIALVAPDTTVVQFLSYEGVLTGFDGPAAGMLSIDIGVAENGTEPLGQSLGLTGTGGSYEDFTWSTALTASFGAVNPGQDFVEGGDLPPSVVSAAPADGAIDVSPDASVSVTFSEPVSLTGAWYDLACALSGAHSGTVSGGPTSFVIDPDSDFSSGEVCSVTILAAGVSDLDGVPHPLATDVTISFTVDVIVAPVFVNEIHYDNTGTDVDEAIEIAGPAGTDLTGYSIVLYNGNGGSVYDTGALSGVLPDQDDGFGTVTLTYPSNGIQNGSPDALALVAPDSTVIQFLSYEGVLTGVGGPADGMLSVDIGVAEDGTEPLGQSLQLMGSGTAYGDFTWSVASSASFGLVNAAQNFRSSTDVPPTVASTVPVDGAVDVDVAASVSVTFDEPVSVTGDWYTIGCSSSGTHTATVSGGPMVHVIDPDSDFLGGETCSVTIAAAGISDLDDVLDPMASDMTFSFTVKVPSVCGGPATPIHAVQGTGAASPLVGSSVTIEGVVVGDYQGSPSGLGGFFVQEEDPESDADPLTSEGIFVFQGGTGVEVAAGEVVRVTGTVSEFFDLTELGALSEVQICAKGATVAPTVVTLPVSAVSDLEAFEGMLLSFPQELFVTETFTQGRFGEVALSANGRLMTPTNLVEPGAPAQAMQLDNDRARIQLDDGSTIQNPAVPPYLAPDNTLRIGDSIDDLIGVLGFAFSAYEVHPVVPLESIAFTRDNPRPAPPAHAAGTLTVSSFNVLNYFTTLDTGSPVCGPTGGLDCRGANTATEFARQREKILSALDQIDADIFGLIELENNATTSIQDLVDGLNALNGPGTYAFIDTGTIGTDAIKVGLVYKPAAVSPVGSFAILDSSVNPAFIDTLNRPVLAQTFQQLSNGERLTVAVNHLKSKGSACAGDPDTGDGQGNCNLTRVAAAQAEAAWLASDPTESGDPDFLIIGDLNAYAKEDPVDAFVGAGFQNLIASFVGPDAYSFVFQGQSGYLDHALATNSLVEDVVSVSEWHVNADEPVMLDYNQEFNPPFVYAPGPFRSADHDPVVVTFDLTEVPPVPSCNGLTATVYVGSNGRIVGGPLAGTLYSGVLLGGAGTNVIVGTKGSDLIQSGFAGSTVCALGGNDITLGSTGRDVVFGGDGNDILQGGIGQDTLSGGAGSDLLVGGAGSDTCDGGPGTDAQTGCEIRANFP